MMLTSSNLSDKMISSGWRSTIVRKIFVLIGKAYSFIMLNYEYTFNLLAFTLKHVKVKFDRNLARHTVLISVKHCMLKHNDVKSI